MYIDAASQIHATANLGLLCCIFFFRSFICSFENSPRAALWHVTFDYAFKLTAYISCHIDTKHTIYFYANGRNSQMDGKCQVQT